MTRPVWSLLSVLFALGASCLSSNNEFCGDGHVCQAGLVCHDDGDSCVPPQLRHCGNGVVEPGEACDEGDREPGGLCSEDCRSDYSCGNGVVDAFVDETQPGEQCDCGQTNAQVQSSDESALCKGIPNSNDGGYCKADCTLHCGDGIRNADEACDPGDFNPNCVIHGFDVGVPACTADCVLDLDPCGHRGFYFEDTPMPSPEARIRAIWGSSQDHVFAVGDNGAFLEYRDRQWQPLAGPNPPADLYAVSGSSPSNVFAAGEAGTIVHYDGSRLTVEPVQAAAANARFVHIWPSDALSALAFTDNGLVMTRRLSSDGEEQGEQVFNWVVLRGTGEFIADVWVENTNSIYIVGEGGTLNNYVGGVRNPAGSPPEGPSYRAVWGQGDELVAVGDGGAISRFYDGSWQNTNYSENVQLRSVWGSDPNSIFVAGADGLILRCDRTECKKLNTVPHGQDPSTYAAQDFDEIWASGPTDVFALARDTAGPGAGVWRYDGVEWSFNDQSIIEAPIRGVWGASAGDIHAIAANGTYATFDGESWTSDRPGPLSAGWLPGDPEINGLAGSRDPDGGAASTLVAVGDRGMVFTFAGAWNQDSSILALADMPDPAPDLLAAWISTDELDVPRETAIDRDVVVAGTDGALFRYLGASSTWESLTLQLFVGETPPTLTAVWGRAIPGGGYEGFVAGDNGTVYRFDDSSNIAEFFWNSGPADFALYGLSGTATTLYAIGRGGSESAPRSLVWRYDDAQDDPSGSDEYFPDIALRTVWAIADNNVYAAGEAGAILHYDGLRWAPVSPFDSTDMTAVWGTHEVVVLADNGGNLWGLYHEDP